MPVSIRLLRNEKGHHRQSGACVSAYDNWDMTRENSMSDGNKKYSTCLRILRVTDTHHHLRLTRVGVSTSIGQEQPMFTGKMDSVPHHLGSRSVELYEENQKTLTRSVAPPPHAIMVQRIRNFLRIADVGIPITCIRWYRGWHVMRRCYCLRVLAGSMRVSRKKGGGCRCRGE